MMINGSAKAVFRNDLSFKRCSFDAYEVDRLRPGALLEIEI